MRLFDTRSNQLCIFTAPQRSIIHFNRSHDDLGLIHVSYDVFQLSWINSQISSTEMWYTVLHLLKQKHELCSWDDELNMWFPNTNHTDCASISWVLSSDSYWYKKANDPFALTTVFRSFELSGPVILWAEVIVRIFVHMVFVRRSEVFCWCLEIGPTYQCQASKSFLIIVA